MINALRFLWETRKNLEKHYCWSVIEAIVKRDYPDIYFAWLIYKTTGDEAPMNRVMSKYAPDF